MAIGEHQENRDDKDTNLDAPIIYNQKLELGLQNK